MAENKNNKKEKLSFWEFLDTIRWFVVFVFKLSPIAAVSQLFIRIILNLSPIFNAYIFALLLDKIIKVAGSSNSNPNEVLPLLGILLIYNLLISGFNYAFEYAMDVMGNLSNYKAPQLLYDRIHSLGIQTLENPEVANKIQRSREIIFMMASDFDRVTGFISRLVTLFSVSYIIFRIMPVIALIILGAMIPEMISNRFHMRKSWKLYRDETENKRRANWAFSQLIETSNLQEMIITSASQYISDVYKTFANRYMMLDLKIMRNWQAFGFLFGSITEIASIFGYFSILKNLFYKLISIGDVTFQMRSLDTFVNNLGMVVNNYTSLYERCIRLNEVKKVFDMQPMISDGSMELSENGVVPKIKFENISFKYPNSQDYVIKDLNLEIKPGEKIAIVGENGAGKTTLVKLLARFYRVDKGRILLDENNINDVKIGNWYKNLGVLFQDYNTYSALTLKENIYLGASGKLIDVSGIEISANKANIKPFMVNYKNGYEQVLSEKFKGGTRPSTGQWQKIAIARFFYRNSPVVVFDEPTASIDAVSEAEIFGQIYDFFKGKTVIIISHRFSTVRNADKIYVLDKGEIVESGNHKELMKVKGKYYKAFNIQAKGYK